MFGRDANVQNQPATAAPQTAFKPYSVAAPGVGSQVAQAGQQQGAACGGDTGSIQNIVTNLGSIAQSINQLTTQIQTTFLGP